MGDYHLNCMSEQQSPKFEVGPIKKEQHNCMSCESPFATAWSTTEGKAWLCRECANLHGLGCP
jgi:hypothetical protein